MQIDQSFLDDFYFELLVKGDYQASLETLRHAFDSHSGGILSGDGVGVTMLTAQGVNPESVDVYNRHLSQEDYLLPFMYANSRDKTLSASQLVNLKDIEGTDYYQFVDKPSDVYDKICFHVVAPQQHFSISLYRDKNRPFSSSEHEFAQKTLPHLSRGFRLLDRKSRTLDSLFDEMNLTKREAEIATFISIGNDYARIRAALHISSNTLKWHMKNIFQKFEVRNLTELAVALRSVRLQNSDLGKNDK